MYPYVLRVICLLATPWHLCILGLLNNTFLYLVSCSFSHDAYHHPMFSGFTVFCLGILFPFYIFLGVLPSGFSWYGAVSQTDIWTDGKPKLFPSNLEIPFISPQYSRSNGLIPNTHETFKLILRWINKINMLSCSLSFCG